MSPRHVGRDGVAAHFLTIHLRFQLLCPPPRHQFSVLYLTTHPYSLVFSQRRLASLGATTTTHSLTMPPRWKSDYGRKPPRFAWFKSCLPLLVIVILFSFLLSSVALLSHFRSPAAKQQLGWQAWDVVEMHYASKTGSKANTTEGNEMFSPSIPLDVWVSSHSSWIEAGKADVCRTHYLLIRPV